MDILGLRASQILVKVYGALDFLVFERLLVDGAMAFQSAVRDPNQIAGFQSR
jgi:hypothetical protein